MKVSKYVKMLVTGLAIESDHLRFFGFQTVPLSNGNIFNPRTQTWRLNLSNLDFLASGLSYLRKEINCKIVDRKLEYCLCGSTLFPCKGRYGQLMMTLSFISLWVANSCQREILTCMNDQESNLATTNT